MFKIKVNLQENSYHIIYASNSIQSILDQVKLMKPGKVCLVADKNAFTYYGMPILESLQNCVEKVLHYSFLPGESKKNIQQVMSLLDYCLENKWNRNDIFVILGGGVTGDMGAFAASILLRGINFIAIPTTLLAQVDSSIGGKTGIDHKTGKNLIGTFYQPKQVILDSTFLKTLPYRQIQTGMAEIIKYAIISDISFYETLDSFLTKNPLRGFKHFSPIQWEPLLKTCASIKASVVGADEKEGRQRMILNYGHTFGHALETMTGYNTYTHGEAVSIGMHTAALMANKIGICDQQTVARQENLLKKAGLPTSPKQAIDIDSAIDIMKVDKKSRNNMLTFILPEKIGTVRIAQDLSIDEVTSLLKEIFHG